MITKTPHLFHLWNLRFLFLQCLMTSMILMVSIPSEVVAQTPIARYRFENNANDTQGGHNGSLKRSPSFSTDGIEGSYAISLVRSKRQFVDIAHPDFEDAFNELTVAAWVKANGTSNTQVIYEEGGPAQGLTLRINGNMLEARVRQGNKWNLDVSTPFTAITWKHVAVRYDNGSLSLFVNGSLAAVNSTTNFTTVSPHGNGAGIGGVNSANTYGGSDMYFDGSIDDVRIYDEALTDGQVTDIYNEYMSPAYSLLARYRFENNANDSQGGHNGSLVGSPSFSTDSNEGSYAISLNRLSNQFVDVAHPDFEDVFNKLTVAAWVKANGTSNTQVIYEEGGPEQGLTLRINGNMLEARVRQKNTWNLDVSTPFTAITWKHVAVRYDNGSLSLFVNGSLAAVNSTTNFTTVSPHGNDAGIGGVNSVDTYGNSGMYFDGSIDDVRIYDDALADGQVTDIYKEAIPSTTTNLIANGDFSNGTSDWSFLNNTGGSFTISGGQAQIEIGTPGPEIWKPQLIQSGIPLIAGNSYTLSFNARAAAIRNIEVFFSSGPNDWIRQVNQNISLGPTMQDFTIDFIANVSDTDTRLDFNLGAAADEVTIDNIVLTNNGVPKEETELISNGGFDNDTNAWTFLNNTGGSFSVSGGQALINVGTPGPDLWRPQIIQEGLPIVVDKYYTLSYDARATTEKTIETQLTTGGDDGFRIFVKENTSLTTTMQTFSYTFRAWTSFPNSRLDLNVGGSVSGTVIVDNISLKEVPPCDIGLSVSEHTFESTGGSVTIDISNVNSFTVQENRDWLTTSISGNQLTITASQHTGGSDRLARIVVLGADCASNDVAITQIGTATNLTLPDVGIGLGDWSYWQSAPYFADLAKQVDWRHTDSWTEDGYPASVSLPSEDAFTGGFIHLHATFNKYPAGNYTLTWTGENEVYLDRPRAATVVSEDLSGEVKRRVYHINEEEKEIILLADSFPIENVHFWLPGYDETYDSIFTREFIAYVAPFVGTPIRSMGLTVTNHSTEKVWADRRLLSDGTYYRRTYKHATIPYEALVKLANVTGTDMYLAVPHQVDATYITNLAHLIKTGVDLATGQQTGEPLAPGLRVWLEYSNEVWNRIFDQYNWVNNLDISWGNNRSEKYANKSIWLWETFEAQFSDNDRVIRVLAGQATNDFLANILLEAVDGQAEVFGITTYFSFDAQRWIHENWPVTSTQLLDYLENAVGDPTLPLELDNPFKDISGRRKVYDLAANYGLPVIAYEGNEHIDAVKRFDHDNDPGTRFESIWSLYGKEATDLLAEAFRNSRFENIMKKWWDRNHLTGLRTNTLFILSGRWDRFGQWGFSEYIGQPILEATKLKAALDYYGLAYPVIVGGNERRATLNLGTLDGWDATLPFYPNPASGTLFLSEGPAQVDIFTIAGKQVLSSNGKVGQLDISALKSGLYIISVDQVRAKLVVD